jgi:hypothetical protein
VLIASDSYRNCQEHLRELHEKRDRLIAFYAVIIGACVASLQKLGNLTQVLAPGLGAAGVVASITLIQ